MTNKVIFKTGNNHIKRETLNKSVRLLKIENIYCLSTIRFLFEDFQKENN